jgi:hypothetical protein
VTAEAHAPFLAVLQAAADNAAEAEAQFRRDANRRFAALEAARAFAHRRLNLMRAIADAAAQPESEEIAVANALAVLKEKLGWRGDSEARSEALSRFAPVARAVARSSVSAREDGGPEPDVMTTLAEFEAWYAQNHPGPFWALFEQHFPETPLVDF